MVGQHAQPRMVVACNKPGRWRLRLWLSNWRRGLRPNLRSGRSIWKVPTSCSQASPQRNSRTRGRSRRGKRLSFVSIVVHDIDVEVVERRTLAWPLLVRWSPAPFLAWFGFGPRASRSIRRARCRARAVDPPVVKDTTKSQSSMPVWRSAHSILG